MNCWIRSLALMAGLLLTGAAMADVQVDVGGCFDAKGHTVASVKDEALPVLYAVRDQDGQPTIHYNPALLPSLLPESRAFLFAHECGRLYLGQPDSPRTIESAHKADCWAVETIRRSGIAKDKTVLDAIEQDLSLPEEAWAMLPGPMRELSLSQCSSATQKIGNLKIDSKGSDPRWNACQQSCGSRLYACGRGASCQAAFNQCSARCDGSYAGVTK